MSRKRDEWWPFWLTACVAMTITPSLKLFHRGEKMAAPEWTRKSPLCGRPETVFSVGRKKPERTQEKSRDSREGKDGVRLEKTTGVMAVGACSPG